MLGQSEFNVLVDPRAASKITQGITTEITGEGASIAPLNDALAKSAQPTYDRFKVTLDFRTLNDYFARLEKNRPAINVGTFVGAGGVRAYVLGSGQKAAAPADLEAMKKLVEQAMQHGALGVSTSLQYVPGRFATTDEIVELAKVARQYGGIYISHQRSESGQIMSSLDEVFAVAERANIPAEVWHLKTAYRANWGRMAEVLKRFDEARARGLDVTANMYPYDRASNGLDACLPLWVREGGLEQMLARLKDPALRDRIKRDMDDANAKDWENQWYGSGGGAGVMVSTVLDPSLQEMGRQEPRRDRQGDGEGSARRGDGSGDRRSRRDVGDHLDHARRRRAAGAVESDDLDRHRFRRARRGRAVLGIEVASARVGIVHARARQVRAR